MREVQKVTYVNTEDIQEIKNLLIHFGQYVDELDHELHSSLFVNKILEVALVVIGLWLVIWLGAMAW